MGFCTTSSTRASRELPDVEKYIVDGRIFLIKYLARGEQQGQERRFGRAIEDPLPPVEALRHGPAVAGEVVRVLARAADAM